MGWLKDFFNPGEEAKIETYEIKTFCLNCKDQSLLDIEQGKSVKEGLKRSACRKCKNESLVPFSLNIYYLVKDGVIMKGFEIEDLINWEDLDMEYLQKLGYKVKIKKKKNGKQDIQKKV